MNAQWNRIYVCNVGSFIVTLLVGILLRAAFNFIVNSTGLQLQLLIFGIEPVFVYEFLWPAAKLFAMTISRAATNEICLLFAQGLNL